MSGEKNKREKATLLFPFCVGALDSLFLLFHLEDYGGDIVVLGHFPRETPRGLVDRSDDIARAAASVRAHHLQGPLDSKSLAFRRYGFLDAVGEEQHHLARLENAPGRAGDFARRHSQR